MSKFNQAFWDWFGKSKVVDKNGNPMVVYHATGAPMEFTSFKRKLSDLGIHFGTLGQAEDRMAYMAGKRPSDNWRVIPVYLSIQNPLRMSDAGAWNWENIEYPLSEKFGESTVRDRLRNSSSANGKTAALRDLIEERGYDGVVYKNTGETSGAAEYAAIEEAAKKDVYECQKRRGKPLSCYDKDDQATPEYLAHKRAFEAYEKFREDNAEDSWIAFHPEQIKSATGNNGNWSRKSKDIRSNPDPLAIEAERILRGLAR